MMFAAQVGANLRHLLLPLLVYGSLALFPFLIALVYFWAGRGPRRRRAYRRAQRALQAKAWREGLAAVEQVKALGRLSTRWEQRVRGIEGQCQRLAGDDALLDNRFEESFERFKTSAWLLGSGEAEGRARVVEAMLAELRRLFATQSNPAPALAMAERTLALDPTSAEAGFWQGLCQVRNAQTEPALESFRAAETRERELAAARGGPRLRAPDPLLYLGALLLREGRVQEALRHLSEAYRLWPECPFVAWQLGLAIVAGGGDSLAVRALQKALGPTGLPAWEKDPRRGWIDGFPGPVKAGKEELPGAFVRRLASEHPFHCPVLGHDVPAMIRQGKAALAQAQYRLGRYGEAAELFQAVLQDSPPTLPILRGLGMALVRQGQFDQAFKHLRAAYEIESAQPNDKTYQAAAYLALCGAKGKPYRPEDKINNVVWAIRLLGQYSVKGDAEWARISSAVFAEARAQRIRVSAEDQLRLCDSLASVDAADAEAAEAYEELFATAPTKIRPEHAWLYARAAQSQNAGTARGLPLLAQACDEGSAAAPFFHQRQWDFNDAVYTYLQRLSSCQAPGTSCQSENGGQSPSGSAQQPDLATRNWQLATAQAELLLSRSRGREDAGDRAGAIAAAEVLHTLAPHDRRGPDRLAQLHYRQGNLHRAAATLAALHALDPSDPLPLVRRAVVEQQRGNPDGCFEAIDAARALLQATGRAAAAFLGARLALAAYFRAPDRRPGHACWQQARRLLDACLADVPHHAEARACLAALHAAAADREGLAEMAPLLDRPEIRRASFQYLSAACHLAGGAAEAAEQAARYAATLAPPPSLQPDTDTAGEPAARPPLAMDIEAEYLIGLARLAAGDVAGAEAALRAVAGTSSPAVDSARAHLGRMHFQSGNHASAVLWWSAVDPGRRLDWKLQGPLRDTVFLTAVEALETGRYEAALDGFREAGRLGVRDPRLGALITRARVKAAQQHLKRARELGDPDVPLAVPIEDSKILLQNQGPEPAVVALTRTHAAETAAWLLKSAVQAGCQDANVGHLLARAYKLQGNALESRNSFRQIRPRDVFTFLQLGLLALRERAAGFASPLAQAEEEFEQAWKWHVETHAPGNGSVRTAETAAAYAAAYNLLLTRLSQGKRNEAADVVPGLLSVTVDPEERRRLMLLQVALHSVLANNDEGALLVELSVMTDAEEDALLRLVRSLGHIETSAALLQALAAARPRSEPVREAAAEAQLLRAKGLLDRCEAADAERVLTPLAYDRSRRGRATGPTQIALLNLVGCCACLLQDFEGGARSFTDALALDDMDPRLHQNLALAFEFQRLNTQAERAWDRFLDRVDERIPAPPGRPDYSKRLTLECLLRLAARNYERENWPIALAYYNRARPLRSDDPEILDRLFHINNQLGRGADARRVLDDLREIRAGSPQLELYELEVQEVRTADDVLRLLGEIERVLRTYPQDAAVADRAAGILGNLINFMMSAEKQFRQQLRKTERSLAELPSYQINWPEVHGYLRDVRGRLAKLRRTADRGLGMATLDRHRRLLQQLRQAIESDLELCKSLAG